MRSGAGSRTAAHSTVGTAGRGAAAKWRCSRTSATDTVSGRPTLRGSDDEVCGWPAHRATDEVPGADLLAGGRRARRAAGREADRRPEERLASWLPGSAESTKVLEMPAVVPVAERAAGGGGLRAARRAHAGRPGQGRRRRRAFARFEGVDGKVDRADPVAGRHRRCRPSCRSTSARRAGNRRRGTSPTGSDELAGAGANGLAVHVTGPAGIAADSADGVRGHRQHAAVRHDRRRRAHPAGHLPQPGAVAAAGASRRASR